MNDPTETVRRERLAQINTQPGSRVALEARHGKVWSTDELREEFEVIGFMAPLVVVRRRADGMKGPLEFQRNPRFYFNFQPHEDSPYSLIEELSRYVEAGIDPAFDSDMDDLECQFAEYRLSRDHN